MTRSIKKALEEYDKLHDNGKNDSFYVSDLEQIVELAKNKREGSRSIDIYELMSISLKAGYVIGARAAKRA